MLLEHARQELKLAGYNIDREIPSPFKTDDDYSDACAKNAYNLLELFSEAQHSGFSANVTLQLFNRLATFQNLTPLTNDISEWKDVSEYEDKPAGTKFQSKRKYSCFSEDGLKTYYDLNENEEHLVDEYGCGYTQAKPKDQWVYHELPNKENK